MAYKERVPRIIFSSSFLLPAEYGAVVFAEGKGVAVKLGVVEGDKAHAVARDAHRAGLSAVIDENGVAGFFIDGMLGGMDEGTIGFHPALNARGAAQGAIDGLIAGHILGPERAGAGGQILLQGQEKEEKRLEGELKRSHSMLSNEKFISKAPQAKIDEEKAKLAKYEEMIRKVREQIAQLQAKEKDLAEQKQMAEDAEAMKIIRKYKISSERLQMLNKLSEDEVRNLLQKREQEKEVSINEKQEIIG